MLLRSVLMGLLACHVSAGLSNGVYTITSKYSSKYVEAASASTTVGANIATWSKTGHDCQKWLINKQSDGYYSIVNLHSGMAMTVHSASTANNANVEQATLSASDVQHWAIASVSGYYSIINKSTKKSLDLSGWGTADGSNIAQYEYWTGDCQLWKLTLVTAMESSAGTDKSATDGATKHWGLSGALGIHDPTLYYETSLYWSFYTGSGILAKYSSDGLVWKEGKAVLSKALSWWAKSVPAHSGTDVWAPDLKYYNGKPWMYYSISTFGSQVSAIGLLTATTIAKGDWSDWGVVVASTSSGDWNAIDPDLVVAYDGSPWLVFGSWFSGIKLRRLNPTTMKPLAGGTQYSLAYKAGGIEAPSIIYRKGYYYLFVSIGVCCAGTSSTYKIAYGRSSNVYGPYVDKSGVAMLNGGGSILDAGSKAWVGPGGQDILNNNIIIRHAYDASANGAPKLLISTLNWDSSGWPKY